MSNILTDSFFAQTMAHVFPVPEFVCFMRLLEGWILCPSRHTITSIYHYADPDKSRLVGTHYYFFRDAKWNLSHLFAIWSRLLVAILCRNQKVLDLAVDDTVHKKTGQDINGARTCRDAVRSTQKK